MKNRKDYYLLNHFGFNPRSARAPLWARIAYQKYHSQKTRCGNKKNAKYKWYGEKGICVDYSLIEFMEWFKGSLSTRQMAVARRNRKAISVGRIDHSKNYSLDNIEIQTTSENSRERILRLGTPEKKVVVVGTHKKSGKRMVVVGLDNASAAFKTSKFSIWSALKRKTKPRKSDWEFSKGGDTCHTQ